MGRRYDQEGRVRKTVHLKAAYTKGVLENYSERHWVLSARASQAALFASQKGGPMTACSMARFLKVLYREAGTAGAVLAQWAADADHAWPSAAST